MKKNIFNLGLSLTILGSSFLLLAPSVRADAVAGDTIVTLGEDLTVSQKNTVLEDMGVKEKDVHIVYVSNGEEHKYLGDYIPSSQIGTKAISSAKITISEKNTGLIVESKNISYISNEMYLNSLSTAGLSDAQVYITSPVSVSGTGALTGIIKAYEETSGKKIDENKKLIANEEMVTTAQLAESDDIGEEKAVELIKQIKEEISKEEPKTEEDLRTIIERVAAELGINLTTDQFDKLVSLFNKIKDLDIDWQKVNNTFLAAKDKINEFTTSEEGKNMIDSLIAFMNSIWNWITSFFTK